VETSDGTLLGGRVRYAQPRTGYRSGIEPVLLAATIPARAGERVMEGGAGAGAALLCSAWRVPGIAGVGVERDPALVALAARNAASNALSGLDFVAADMACLPELGWFDHACANPPYHADNGTAPPDDARSSAKHAAPGLLHTWIVAMAERVRLGGTLTLIMPPAALDRAVNAFRATGCGSVVIFPLWPKLHRPAKLILLRAARGGRASLRIASGMTLHCDDGKFTEAAEACLRLGAPLHL
jgi:tRNA1Val (adenine37-N6)-methyltransferase